MDEMIYLPTEQKTLRSFYSEIKDKIKDFSDDDFLTFLAIVHESGRQQEKQTYNSLLERRYDEGYDDGYQDCSDDNLS